MARTRTSCIANSSTWRIGLKSIDLKTWVVVQLKTFNQVLLLQWWWNYFTEQTKPWRTLIQWIYYHNKPPLVPSAYQHQSASLFWKGVLKMTNLFKGLTTPVVKNGKQTPINLAWLLVGRQPTQNKVSKLVYPSIGPKLHYSSFHEEKTVDRQLQNTSKQCSFNRI